MVKGVHSSTAWTTAASGLPPIHRKYECRRVRSSRLRSRRRSPRHHVWPATPRCPSWFWRWGPVFVLRRSLLDSLRQHRSGSVPLPERNHVARSTMQLEPAILLASSPSTDSPSPQPLTILHLPLTNRVFQEGLTMNMTSERAVYFAPSHSNSTSRPGLLPFTSR